jgi:hypothetical protein
MAKWRCAKVFIRKNQHADDRCMLEAKLVIFEALHFKPVVGC